MIVDLQDQLRELCTVIDEKQGRIREHDVRTRSDAVMVVGGTSGPAAPDVRRRRWPIAVATATVIIAAALPFLVLSDTEEDSPPADAAASDDWSRVLNEHDVFGGAGDQRMVAITEGGPGLVAVGSDDSLGSQRAAVWTSVDGSTWSRASDQGTDFGTADDETMQDVTTGGPGLVAVGSVCAETQVEYADWADEYYDNCVDRNAAVWTSVDGVTWARVPNDDSIFSGHGDIEMASVTASGPRLVAVGSESSFDEYPDGGYGEGSQAAAVWTSEDGITWSRVPHNDSIFGEATIESVTTGGPGFVAVGSGDFAGDPVAIVWTSPDGLNWSRVPHAEGVFGGPAMLDVTPGKPGLVAVGGLDSAVFVWTSVDGITWSQHRYAAEFTPPVFQSVSSVIAGGPGLVAVGIESYLVQRADAEGHLLDASVAVVWTSRDGVTWSRVPHNESVFGGGGFPEMVDVAAQGSNLIAVGWVCAETQLVFRDGFRYEEDCTDVDAVVWRANN